MHTLTFTEHDLTPEIVEATIEDGTPFVHLPETASLAAGHTVTLHAPGASPVLVLARGDRRVGTIPGYGSARCTLVCVEPVTWTFRLV